MRGVLTFNDQDETCDNCGLDAMVRTVLDRETERYYWFCPHCDQGNVSR